MFAQYLTKSKFNLAMGCPTKLYYQNKDEYANQKSEDSFLKALAEGGFQVAALAKCVYPEGILIESLDYDESLKKTSKFLQNKNVTLFEAAICYQNLFLRADILIKDENHIQLIEVKSKSIDSGENFSFWNKKNDINSEWKDYLFDVAFQKYILLKAYPDCQISSHLLLVDKSVACQTEGLNQKFRIKKNEDKVEIIISEKISPQDIFQNMLCKKNVDFEIEYVFSKLKFDEDRSFSEHINFLAKHLCANEKIKTKLGAKCAKCEFRVTENDKDRALCASDNETKIC